MPGSPRGLHSRRGAVPSGGAALPLKLDVGKIRTVHRIRVSTQKEIRELIDGGARE